MTLVDTNVLLDLVTDDPRWARWSIEQLDAATASGTVVCNPIVYAEVSIGFDRIETVDGFLADAGIAVIEMPREALFLAGKAFQQYRRRGGHRPGVLPDFFIGAHAAVSGMKLLTRDAARIRTYFPSVDLFAPA
ncbi:type II toxin-antitoxin system VapC family toxin [Alsobacter sp. R-9]